MRTAPLLLGVLLLAGCTSEPAEPSAAPSPATSPAPVVSVEPSPTPVAQAVRLTGDGIDTGERLVAFGDAFEDVEPALRAALGAPTRDTGVTSSFTYYGTCPGTKLRGLEYGDGALRLLFGDVIGPGLTLYQWTLTELGRPADVPQASALVGDVTTYEFGVGTTLGELRAGTQGSELEVRPGSDEGFGPSFSLTDQSSGFFGTLSGTTDSDRVVGVQGGEGCGE